MAVVRWLLAVGALPHVGPSSQTWAPVLMQHDGCSLPRNAATPTPTPASDFRLYAAAPQSSLNGTMLRYHLIRLVRSAGHGTALHRQTIVWRPLSLPRCGGACSPPERPPP